MSIIEEKNTPEFKRQWQVKLKAKFQENPAFKIALYCSIYSDKMWSYKNRIASAIVKNKDKKYDDILLTFPTGWAKDIGRVLMICDKGLWDEIAKGIPAGVVHEWIEEIVCSNEEVKDE